MKGFLPNKTPLREYTFTSSKSLNRLNEIASNLPKLLLTGRVPKTIKSLKKNDFSVEELLMEKSMRDLKLAMVQLSFIAHSFIW